MAIPSTKPTQDEARNGWSEEALAKYREEREAQALEFAINKNNPKPVQVVGRKSFNPHSW